MSKPAPKYTHRVVYTHIRKYGPLKGTEVEGDFRVCSHEDAVKALHDLAYGDEIEFTDGRVETL